MLGILAVFRPLMEDRKRREVLVALSAAYMLVLYRRVVFGPQNNMDAAKMPDLTPREFGILIPLVLFVIYLGIFPSTVTNAISPSVEKLIVQYETALE